MVAESRETQGKLPYSNEEAPPATPKEAVEDFIRYTATLMPEARAVELMSRIDPSRIMQVIYGRPVTPPLDGFEKMVASAVDYHMGQGVIGTTTEVICAITSVQFDLEKRRTFDSKEKSADQQ